MGVAGIGKVFGSAADIVPGAWASPTGGEIEVRKVTRGTATWASSRSPDRVMITDLATLAKRLEGTTRVR